MVAATLAGISCVFEGADSVVHGGPGVVTSGQLAGVVVGVVGIGAIMALLFRTRRRRFDWPLVAATLVSVSAMFYAQSAGTTPLIRTTGWWLLTIGIILLAAAWFPLVSGRVFADRIVDPRTGKESVPVPRLRQAVLRWGIPVVLVLAVVLIMLVPTSHR
jgi:hypothetical protein